MNAPVRYSNGKPVIRVRSGASFNSYAPLYQSAGRIAAAVRAWETIWTDGDGDLHEFPDLRAKSWDLMRNNPLAIGGINTHVTDTIGTGLELHCRVDRALLMDRLSLSDDDLDVWEQRAEDRFRWWAETPIHCDLEAQQNFYEQQCTVYASELVAGDGLGLITAVQRRHSPFMTRVQLIDPDRLSNPQNASDSSRLAGGVERDGNGAAIAHHFRQAHPGSIKLDEQAKKFLWRRIPTFGAVTGRQNVVHMFVKERPGRSRGVPKLAPLLAMFKQLGRYTDAEIMAALVHSFFTVFVKSDEDALSFGAEQLEEQEQAGVQASRGEVGLGYGNIVDLASNENIELAKAERPHSAFDPFMESMFTQLGVGMDMPKEMLTKQFKSSYSAARGAFLQWWKTCSKNRKHTGLYFCAPVYQAWLAEQVATGALEAPGFFTDPVLRWAWSRHVWIGPPRGQIDPVKETQAEQMQHDILIKPLADICSSLTGQDWDSVVERIARERRKIKRLDLPEPAAAQITRDTADAVEPSEED